MILISRSKHKNELPISLILWALLIIVLMTTSMVAYNYRLRIDAGTDASSNLDLYIDYENIIENYDDGAYQNIVFSSSNYPYEIRNRIIVL